MKYTTPSLLLTLAIALLAPTAANPSITARDMTCEECFSAYDFCVENGHTEGQTGCKKTCVEHVCHRVPECKGCGDEFDECPEESRYLN